MVNGLFKRQRQFHFRGYTLSGAPAVGVIKQFNVALARTELTHQGIDRVEFKPMAHVRLQRRITARDCHEFTRQLSVLLQVKLPLLQALDLLNRSLKHPRWAPVLAQIRSDVSQGQSLASAFGQYPQYFDALFCSLIAAGEQAGALSPLCTRLVAHQTRTERLRQQVRAALRYPLIVLIIAGALSIVLLTQVVPSFADLFAGFSAELPVLTRILIDLSQWVKGRGLVEVGLWVSSFVVLVLCCRQPRLRPYRQRFSFAIPVLGHLQHHAAAAHLCHTLALSLSARVPLMQALNIAIEASQHPQLLAHKKSILAALAAGNSLHAALAEFAQLPELLLEIIQTGEDSGTLVTLLERAASLYDEQLEAQMKTITTWLEPMLMVVLAVLIGGLLLALYLPIFSMGSLL